MDLAGHCYRRVRTFASHSPAPGSFTAVNNAYGRVYFDALRVDALAPFALGAHPRLQSSAAVPNSRACRAVSFGG